MAAAAAAFPNGACTCHLALSFPSLSLLSRHVSISTLQPGDIRPIFAALPVSFPSLFGGRILSSFFLAAAAAAAVMEAGKWLMLMLMLTGFAVAGQTLSLNWQGEGVRMREKMLC